MPGYALFVAGAANSDRRVELLAMLIFREQLENDSSYCRKDAYICHKGHQLLKTIPGLNRIHNSTHAVHTRHMSELSRIR